jgi:hypothetical protein
MKSHIEDRRTGKALCGAKIPEDFDPWRTSAESCQRCVDLKYARQQKHFEKEAELARTKKAVVQFDVIITGELGLYEIEPLTRAGKAWMDENLSDGDSERTRMGESVICDDAGYCRDIVAAMDHEGLKVEMNGVDMKGFSKTR